MTHTGPWGRLQGVSSHHLPGKLAGASAVPAAPELPGKNYLASRQADLTMETPSPFPEGFTHAGLCHLLTRGVADPSGTAWPGTPAASAAQVSQPAGSLSQAGSPRLPSKRKGKKGERQRLSRHRVTACPYENGADPFSPAVEGDVQVGSYPSPPS